jgi:hypothetical protein
MQRKAKEEKVKREVGMSGSRTKSQLISVKPSAFAVIIDI